MPFTTQILPYIMPISLITFQPLWPTPSCLCYSTPYSFEAGTEDGTAIEITKTSPKTTENQTCITWRQEEKNVVKRQEPCPSLLPSLKEMPGPSIVRVTPQV